MPCCKGDEFSNWCKEYGTVYKDEQGNEYCIFHAPKGKKGIAVEEFNEQVFERINKVKAENKACNLAGTIFEGEISFSQCGEDNPLPVISFEKAAFSGEADFEGAAFSGQVNFKGVKFSEGACFREAAFSRRVNFNSAVFSGRADLAEAAFSGQTIFRDVKFSKEVCFSEATFSEGAYFTGATFSEGAYFTEAKFSERVNFSSVEFSGEAYFMEAAFSKEAVFWKATFSKKTNFVEVTFSQEANFVEVTFSQGANFRSAELTRTELRGTNLKEVDFTKANLSESNLEGATFEKADLSYAKLKNADLKDADLKDATGLGSAQVGGTKFTGAKLPEDFREFDFLDVIAEISKNARKVFFAMLLACIYSLLTVATTTDAQLLVNSASSPLPIIGTQIPIAWFYLAAPIILVINYFYFHLYLQRLWEGLSSLPARFTDGRRADELAYPWILNSLVRRYFMFLKKDRPLIAVLEELMTFFVGWWVVPLTLLVLWLRYLPRHDWIFTILQITLLVISIGLLIWFLNLTSKTLQGNPPKPQELRKAFRSTRNHLKFSALAITGSMLIFISWNGMNVDSNDLGVFKLIAFTGYRPYAELTEEELSIKPRNWTGKEIDLVKGAKLKGAKLQNAQAARAFLVKADLRLANLQEANLWGANLQKADLRFANLQEANLYRANLQEADPRGANLQEADLSRAELRGAKNLTIDKLSKVKTLYQAILDPELEKQLKEKHPHLFEKPKEK